MEKIRAAFFDIDGTLLTFGDRQMPASTLRALQGMRRAGIKLFIASGRPPFHLKRLPPIQSFSFDGYVLTNGQFCADQDLTPFFVRALTHTTYQLSLYIPPAMDAVFGREVPGCRAVRWNEAFADIIPADGGKAEGLARMMARHGIQAGACIAFGDGGNDIDMLRAVGIGVAMGNAAPAVQAAADYVTDRVDRDGIWKAAVHFGLIQE